MLSNDGNAYGRWNNQERLGPPGYNPSITCSLEGFYYWQDGLMTLKAKLFDTVLMITLNCTVLCFDIAFALKS